MRHVVERCSAISQNGWVMNRCGRHQCAHPDRLSDRCYRGQNRTAIVELETLDVLPAGVWHVMVSEPESEITKRVGHPGDV